MLKDWLADCLSRRSSETYVAYLKKNGCDIGKGVYFYSPSTTTVDRVRMNWISIGDYTKITQGVIILAHDYAPSVLLHTHHRVVLGGGRETVIGSNCFLGMNCIIMPGKRVGNNCIIGAGAVVASDIPDNSVCAGNPARVIMSINEYYDIRQKQYLNDAKRNVKHFIQINKRYPTIKELHGFAFLFLPRTEENWATYYTSYLCHDNDPMDVKSAFFETEPVFENYNRFIEYCTIDE